jgi:secreted trypsin-like serine protease
MRYARSALGGLVVGSLGLGLLAVCASAQTAQGPKHKLGPQRTPEITTRGAPADTKPPPTPQDDALSAIQGRGRVLEIEPRVIGGLPAPVKAYPWLVSLEVSGGKGVNSHFCGGSLIERNWVVTAAHCFTRGAQADSVEILTGTNSLSSGGRRYKVEKIIWHPQWDAPSFRNDVLLLKLAGEGVADATIISMISKEESGKLAEAGTLGTVAGWGLTKEGGSASNALRHVNVKIVSNADCNAPQAYNNVISDEMFCAGFIEGGKDSCQGDSGGPFMVVDGKGGMILAGVVSWGEGCGRANKYGVYTRLWLYDSWIKEVTAGK